MSDTTPYTVPPPPKLVKDRGPVNTWILAITGAGLLILGCCTGFGIGSMGEPEPKVISSPSPYPVTKIVTVAPSPADVPAPTSPAAPTKAAPILIEEGQWTVGVDFPAGTYRVTEKITSMCYWGIYKSGTNGGTIIDNDIVTGGRPTVTLKKGQDFNTTGCGTWEKIR